MGSLKRSILSFAAVLLTGLVSSASADTVFKASLSLTNNNPTDVKIGLDQLRVTVWTDVAAPTWVNFTFTNGSVFSSSSPSSTQAFGSFQASSITDVYFDDGATGYYILNYTNGAIETPKILSSTGVDFSEGAKPEEPPGGGLLDPDFNVTFSADSNKPVETKGVNSQNEWLTISVKLADDRSYDDAVWAVTNGEFRIGIKVQGFASRGSETFAIVPTPSSAMGGSALMLICGIAAYRRRCVQHF